MPHGMTECEMKELTCDELQVYFSALMLDVQRGRAMEMAAFNLIQQYSRERLRRRAEKYPPLEENAWL